MDINQFVIQYWDHIATQNEKELKKYFHENACIRWIIQMSNLMLASSCGSTVTILELERRS